jgi:hypothetical protein
MEMPARRAAEHGADVCHRERGEPEPDASAVREAEAGDENQGRAEQRPRRHAEHRAEQVAVPAARKYIEGCMHRRDDEEGGAEEHAVVVEHARHGERRDEHRDQRDE